MATPIYARPPDNRFLGNDDNRQVHDLWGEKPGCRIDEIFQGFHAVTFSHDSLLRAHAEGCDCPWCVGARHGEAPSESPGAD